MSRLIPQIIILILITVHQITSAPPNKQLRLFKLNTASAAEPTTVEEKQPELTSAEISAQQIRDEMNNPFVYGQQMLYSSNPQWFIQPGRPCNPNLSPEDIYLRKLDNQPSLIPNATILRERAKDYCIGLVSEQFSGIACYPDTETCECEPNQGTWDIKNKKCKVLPGGFCFDFGNVKGECIEGSTCIDTLCVCNDNENCPKKVLIPDPGTLADPRA